MSEALAEDPSAGYPRPADLDLIPLRIGADPSRSSFDLTAGLSRIDGVLYGGTGAAASVVAMEAATQRDALWVVTQFIAPAPQGVVIDVAVEPLAMGGRIAQLEVRATVGDDVIFTALGATAHPRPGGLAGQYVPVPEVTPPEEGGPLPFFASAEADGLAAARRLEYRTARFRGDAPPGAMALWARLRGIDELTRAGVAYLADMIPPAVARAAGKLGGGFSLDNALRFADLPPTEWVLLDLRGELATGGYGHGSLTVWTPDGTLVAAGSQTASMVHLFSDDAAEAEAWRARGT